ncbi:hypothetical protein [Aquimarina macrocephali]|uniref:hypothetical protein n=1 Tax=Aquimarina macrocephali TaxID=666563 RepID=UPI003F672A07
MIDNRSKLEILNRLKEDDFIHERHFEDKLVDIIDDLSDDERDYINLKHDKTKERNDSKGIQIDFFDTLIYEKKNQLTFDSLK